MDLETKWLEDLLMLAETHSFSQAAERRFVTQPAFSRRIRALEQAVGVQLVNRSTTPVELTAEGQLFVATARNVLTQLRDTVGKVRGLQPGEAQVLEVAAAHSLAFTFFPDWVSDFSDVMQELSMRLVAMNVEDAIHALREGECDVMLVYYDPYATLQLDNATFPSLHLADTRMLPVCAPQADGQPRFSLDSPPQDDIPLLSYTRGAFLGRTVRMMMKHHPLSLRLRTVYETAMAEGLKGMALKGQGVAWIPELCIERELAEGKLVVCGGEQWQAPLEIRLYRCALVDKPSVSRVWRQLVKRGAAL
ncbi:LysR substrate-binding domain-containing protein [Pokkaliibacter sp. CJK22405]|uniref:LysR substrate-binding domain-containing protein n=1 Tax=Pokkaliibacter sp. CJK22405 TaxID=3384615 RepID=UPI003985480A